MFQPLLYGLSYGLYMGLHTDNMIWYVDDMVYDMVLIWDMIY